MRKEQTRTLAPNEKLARHVILLGAARVGGYPQLEALAVPVRREVAAVRAAVYGLQGDQLILRDSRTYCSVVRYRCCFLSIGTVTTNACDRAGGKCGRRRIQVFHFRERP